MHETNSIEARLARIALIVPSSNTVMENDLHRWLPKSRYSVHTDRMYLVETTREAEISMIEEFAPAAANDLGTLQPDLLVFGCTSAGTLFGPHYDAKICSQLSQRAKCPVIGVVTAVVAALERRAAKRIAVVTPYIDDLTQSVAKALESSDREIVAAFGMGISTNVELADCTPEQIVKFAKENLEGLDFDTLFVSCANFRAMEAKPLLEQLLGKIVLTSNGCVIEAVRLQFEGLNVGGCGDYN